MLSALSCLDKVVSLARGLIFIGYSHPKASFFLLRGQKKETKEKAALCRLFPALLAFVQGLPEGISLPLRQIAVSLPQPCGLFPAKAALLGAAEGNNPSINIA